MCAAAWSVWAQSQDVVTRGQQVYVQSCTGYCHAPNGAGGGAAPRLAARGFDRAFISEVVSQGVPGTAMQGFASTLPREDLNAVVAYVASLNEATSSASAPAPGGGGADVPSRAERVLTPDAARGRDLFSDATRGVGRCSTCHEVGRLGIPVAGPMSRVPDTASGLRTLSTPLVSTVTMKGDTMPALVVSKGARAVLFYDLTTPPPVLVTADPSSVTIAAGSPWRHTSVIAAYTDDELGSILRFLRDTK